MLAVASMAASAGLRLGVWPVGPTAQRQRHVLRQLGGRRRRRRRQRDVHRHVHLAAEAPRRPSHGAFPGDDIADADPPPLGRAVGHVLPSGEGGAGGRVQQRRRGGIEERQEEPGRLPLAFLPHAQDDRRAHHKRRYRVRRHQVPG